MLPKVAGGNLSANDHKGWGSPKKGGLEEEDRQSKSTILNQGGDCRNGRQGGGGFNKHNLILQHATAPTTTHSCVD